MLLDLRRWPLIPVLYAAALATVHRGRFGALRAVAVDAVARNARGEKVPVIGGAHLAMPFDDEPMTVQVLSLQVEKQQPVTDDVLSRLRNGRMGKRYTPGSMLLEQLLREPLRPVIPDDDDYLETFDRTEVLLGITTEPPPRLHDAHSA